MFLSDWVPSHRFGKTSYLTVWYIRYICTNKHFHYDFEYNLLRLQTISNKRNTIHKTDAIYLSCYSYIIQNTKGAMFMNSLVVFVPSVSSGLPFANEWQDPLLSNVRELTPIYWSGDPPQIVWILFCVIWQICCLS